MPDTTTIYVCIDRDQKSPYIKHFYNMTKAFLYMTSNFLGTYDTIDGNAVNITNPSLMIIQITIDLDKINNV
jgi:hypothetical protein